MSSKDFRRDGIRCCCRGHDENEGMLFAVEWKGVEEAKNSIRSREQGHQLSESITNDGDKDEGDIDGLWLEIVDFLDDGCEYCEANTCSTQYMSLYVLEERE